MENFATWWDALSLPLKFYWAIAVPFTLFFLLQLVWSVFGGSDVPDDTPDAEVTGDAGIPFQFFTIKNLIGFFTIFGWAGVAATDAGASTGVALIVASSSGLVMMTIMAALFYFLAKANADGTMKFEHAVGATGEVYLTIPGKRNGTGKVQVNVKGILRTLDAMTDEEQDIPSGKLIKVTLVLSNNLLIVSVI